MKHIMLFMFLFIPLFSAQNIEAFMMEDDQQPNMLFTKKENAYLQEKKEITACGRHLWQPYIDFTDNQPKGIVVDLAKAYEKIIGIPFRFIRTSNWADCIEKTKKSEIDIVLPILTKPNHHQHLTPTMPVAKDHLVLVSKVEKPFISNIKELGNIKVSIVKGSKSYVQYIKSKYPNLEFVYVNDLQEGSKSVVEERVDAYIGTAIPATFEIRQHYPKELKISGQFIELEVIGSIGVQKSDPILLEIFNKAIDTLDPKIKREIFNNWISVKEKTRFNYSLFWKILATIFFVLIGLIYRQILLKRKHRKATGEDFWSEIVSTPFIMNKRKILHVLWRDISERKKQKYENTFIKERMELALIGSKTSILDWDFTNDNIYISPSWKEMLGFRDEELPSNTLTWFNRAYPKDKKIIFKMLKEYEKKQMKDFQFNHRLKHKDGHWIWVLGRAQIFYDENGKKVRMIGTHTDITTEIQLTTELSELNQTLETKVQRAIQDLEKSQQQAKLGSWKLDIINNQLTWSDETYHIFELIKTEEVASYENFLAAIHPDDLEKVNTAYSKSLKTKEPYEVKHRLLMKDGRIKYVREQCETTFDTTGNALISIGTIQDVSSLHLAEQRLIEKKDMLFKQSRLAQMGEMLSMIAHQWRQPLAAISATSASLELKARLNKLDNDTVLQRAKDISSFSQHLSKTIDDFRNFFKPNKEKTETSYCEILKSVFKIIGISIANKNIKLIQKLNCQSKFISYPNELKQVILNLIKNAEDALIEKRIKNPIIVISTYQENSLYILTISDNAGGIDEKISDKIFDPYFSTKTKKDGTGLGLYMSKTIIEEHCGGTLSFKNRDDGALFKISLPKTFASNSV